jgi:hypothetical protein
MLLIGGILKALHQRGIAMEQVALITDLISAAIEVHRHKIRGPDFFWCAVASLPQGADWPQRPLTPMAALILDPLQARGTLQPKDGR